MRFQKRIKILPGVSLNLSKSGVSTSLGVRGARMTVGNGKTRTSIGIPGTGLSHTSIENMGSQSIAQQSVPSSQHTFVQALLNAIVFVTVLFFSLSVGILIGLFKPTRKRGRNR